VLTLGFLVGPSERRYVLPLPVFELIERVDGLRKQLHPELGKLIVA
jgi:hypothetical protein